MFRLKSREQQIFEMYLELFRSAATKLREEEHLSVRDVHVLLGTSKSLVSLRQTEQIAKAGVRKAAKRQPIVPA